MPHSRITGLHHVAVFVKNIDASVKFWTDTFGFAEKLRWTAGDKPAVMLDTGDGNYLEFFQTPDAPDRGDNWKNDEALAHVALRCVGLDEMLEKARAAGCRVLMERADVNIDNAAKASPSQVPIRIAFFTAPDGVVVELFENDLT
ncbi:MAG: VOC family protein [Planctomycetota bacterium]